MGLRLDLPPRKGQANDIDSIVSIDGVAPVVKGALSPEIIRRVVHNHLSEIAYCYLKEANRTPSTTGGKIWVRWTITPQGFVAQVAVKQNTLGNAALEKCIIEKVQTWRFPEPKGGQPVLVTYPFVFKGGEHPIKAK